MEEKKDKIEDIVENAKVKEVEEKRKAFIAAIEAVQKEHKLKVQAIINATPQGIFPTLVIVPDESDGKSTA